MALILIHSFIHTFIKTIKYSWQTATANNKIKYDLITIYKQLSIYKVPIISFDILRQVMMMLSKIILEVSLI